jgi:regulator of protease activity HflC (stomatin/prohibitin superfamily)
MLDRLIEIVLQFANDIAPWTVIDHYDRGVRLRLGKPKDVMEPGFHWKIPFADNVLTHMVKTKTINLIEQTVTTKDGFSVVVKGVIKYEVSDVYKLLLEVNDPTDALADMVQGIIRDKIIYKAWADCNDQSLTSEISRAAKAEARKWGLSILEITLTDLSLMRSIRLLNTTKL